jgi:hypothetical protein
MAKNAGVHLEILYEESERSFYFKPLNKDKKVSPRNSFRNCWYANRCIHLREGRLSCSVVSYINILNDAIMSNGVWGFETTKNDYIDIYKAKSLDEILTFLAKPLPFCGYCDFSKITFGGKWAVSKKKLSEWME